MRKVAKRMVSLLAALALVFSLGAPVLAEGVPDGGQPCPAHTEHDGECGYVEGVEASPCTHEHNDACGFVEAVEGAPCTFEHEHNEECGYDGVDEATCTFDPASHTHDDACGYVAAVEGQPCNHEHSAQCSFAETLEAAPCTHACELCDPALAMESGPMMAPAALNGVAPMALPTSAVGAVWDGVDFGALAGSGIYYGTYKHATALQDGGGIYGPVTGRDADARPVLWRVMGEEGGDGNLTMLSEYVVDSRAFHTNSNPGSFDYSQAEIRTWLNDSNGFLSSFSSTEKLTSNMVQTNVSTGMYLYDTGVGQTGSFTTTGDGYASGVWPKENSAQQVYLPWGLYSGGAVFVDAGNTRTISLADRAATLRNSQFVCWWLRSPFSYFSDDALSVNDSGSVLFGDVDLSLGVRPAFKLNPSSVIFTSEIVASPDAGQTLADGTNYFADAGTLTKNFKLTVLNAALDADFTAASQTVDASTNPTISAQPGGTVAVALSGGSAPIGANSMAYKIVDSSRAIVGYGTTYGDTNSTSSITVDAKDLAGNNLTAGNYTVYVWEQTGNPQNSHEGGTPRYFTLNVADTVAPTVSSTNPANGATGVATTTNSLSITFNEAMDTATTGTVSLTGGAPAPTLSNPQWSNNDKTVTYSLSGLDYSTTYTYNISGFKDAAGNQMAAVTSGHSFSTGAAPVAPTITSAASTSVAFGTAGSFTVTASGDTPITFSLSGTVPAGVSINSTTGVMSIADTTAVGTHSFTITAANGVLPDATQNFTLTVTAATQAPGITGPAIMELAEGYAAASSGAFALTGSPTPTVTLSGNTGSGKITWNSATNKLDIAAGLAAGSYAVTLTATNGTAPDAIHSFTLTVTDGSSITYTATGSGTWKSGDYIIRSNGPFPKFTGLQCDGTTLTLGTHYTAAEGSTIVTVKESYMQTLAAGNHTFTLLFSDGTATHAVTVEKSAPDGNTPPASGASTPAATSPQTGDSSNMALWLILAASSLCILAGAGLLWWRRRHVQ